MFSQLENQSRRGPRLCRPVIHVNVSLNIERVPVPARPQHSKVQGDILNMLKEIINISGETLNTFGSSLYNRPPVCTKLFLKYASLIPYKETCGYVPLHMFIKY